MTPRHWRSLLAALLLGAPFASLVAQNPVLVSGHVSAVGGTPIQGAHVKAQSIDVDVVTDAQGRYSFIVPSARVRGQAVTLTASFSDRHVRYTPKSADIRLVGGDVSQDFELLLMSAENAPGGGQDSGGISTSRRIVRSDDTLDFAEVAGPTDLASALAGRVVGLDATAASITGGSASLLYRGPHSILGTNEPLVVVDGIVRDNSDFAAATERYGLGGFDYGSPLQDINLADVASIRVLSGPEATLLYGGVGANGVLVVTTKNGHEESGWRVSANHQMTSGAPLQLPSFQNLYGQGLDGQFEFLNGRGGGVNDGVAQSWGPALDGQPRAQASLTQAGQADVRLWQAHPDNVRDYFQAATTSNTNVAVQDAGALGSVRLALGDLDTHGLTPGSSLQREDITLNAGYQPVSALHMTASFSSSGTKNVNAPGTGFDPGNPVAEFTQMGRQVDVDALRNHLRDSSGAQINWIYTDQNNPFFSTSESSNSSDRAQVAGGGSATYTFTHWLSATALDGTDYYTDARLFRIASGWVGGFPFYAGVGNFSEGGFEADAIAAQQTRAGVHLDATPLLSDSVHLTLSAGGDSRLGRMQIRSAGLDSAADLPSAGAPSGASLPNPTDWMAHFQTNALYGTATIANAGEASLSASLRNEWASMFPGEHASTLYPSVSGSLDLAAFAASRDTALFDHATVRAAWWRSGTDQTPYSVETMYGGAAPTGAIAPSPAAGVVLAPNLQPEVTDAWQVGTDVQLLTHRLTVGLTYYQERTSNVILPVPSTDSALDLAVLTNAGAVSNRGIEATLAATVVDHHGGFGWDISANAAKNSNQVDKLYGGVGEIPLGPSMWGLSVEARPGEPIGELVGETYRRDPASHELLLRNGLPLPDSVAGPQVLGNGLPDWVFGVSNTLHYGWLSLSVLVDGHVGGSVFSATNLWGDYAGTLVATAYRPDSGLLIQGIDVATGKANTDHVATQDYYHALAGIQEPWVYSATYAKLREIRLTFALPPRYLGEALPFQGVRASFVARNVYLWAKAPNIDPETAFGATPFYGVEMGQLPAVRSLGIQISITP